MTRRRMQHGPPVCLDTLGVAPRGFECVCKIYL
jgi:hypothetical protein